MVDPAQIMNQARGICRIHSGSVTSSSVTIMAYGAHISTVLRSVSRADVELPKSRTVRQGPLHPETQLFLMRPYHRPDERMKSWRSPAEVRATSIRLPDAACHALVTHVMALSVESPGARRVARQHTVLRIFTEPSGRLCRKVRPPQLFVF